LDVSATFAIRAFGKGCFDGELDLRFLVPDGEPASALETITRRLLTDIDFQRVTLKHEIEPYTVKHVGEGGPEAELASVIP